ncbi:hypothetical protein CKA32_004109 [Geitlerinema sp. FC II]|nr:hypothetical protein CKA32_004109 [Geitlerinema sp. FC II]
MPAHETERWYKFQSLKGILVNFNCHIRWFYRQEDRFQSLKGILVNFNVVGDVSGLSWSGFNPSKGFW